MACLITRPDAQTLFDQYRNMFSANVLGGSQVVPESNEWYVVALNYAMAEEFYAISEQYWKERDPRFACCDNLTKMGAADGVYPNPATFAQGYIILTGTAGAALPTYIDIVASNNHTYRTVSVVPPQMPSSGSLILRVQDAQPGVDGNSAGTVNSGTLSTVIAGVNDTVVICGGSLCGGKPAEACEEFRTRYIARKQYQPRATQAWAINKLLEWPCVTRVIPRGGSCCKCTGDNCGRCECQNCGGSVDFYLMFDNSFACGIAPENILNEAQEWMFGANQGYGEGQVEIGVCGKIVSAIGFMVDLSIDIEACPSASQIAKIRAQVEDFMTLAQPSQILRGRAVELIVSNIVGPNVSAEARFVPVTPDAQKVLVTACGDLEPECDYLPCLRNINFTGPTGTVSGNC